MKSSHYNGNVFISDIAGQDIQAHHSTPADIIRVVRNWLRTVSARRTIPSSSIIWKRYQNFMKDLPETARECHLAVEDLIFNDYTLVIEEWLKTNASYLSPHSSRR
jgi:hypothetical protein